MRDKLRIALKEINILKSEIEIRYQRRILSHRDCEMLAEDIKNSTNTTIGVTTLRRFFAIDVSDNIPSHYTLDTLSVYCGYHSWQQFVAMKKPGTGNKSLSSIPATERYTEVFVWDELKKEAEIITGYTLKALEKKFGNYYDCIAPGQSIIDRISGLLQSDKTTTAFIAPGGYGKTSMLAKAVEYFWYGSDCLYPEDICWFIDASMLNILMNSNFDFLQWLASQFGIERRNLREFYKNNPSERRGRIVLIFDSLDEVVNKGINITEIFNILVNFIATNENSSWFKIILSFRNASWNKFLQFHKVFYNLQDQWYETPFVSYNEDFTNVQPLDDSTIEEFIALYCKKLPLNLFVELNNAVLSRHFNEYLSKPEFLYLFLSSVVNDKKIPSNEVMLISRYLEKNVFCDSLSEDKQYIMEQLAHLIAMQKKGDSVTKKKLFSGFEVKNLLKAYEALLSVGIITERMNFNKYGTFTMYVRFSDTYIYEYLVALNELRQGFLFDNENLERVVGKYDDVAAKLRVMLWIVKIAIYNNQYDFVFNLKSFFQSVKSSMSKEDYWSLFYPVIEYIGTVLRYNTGASGNLILRFSQDSEWRKLYFETFVDIDYLMINYGLYLEVYLDYSRGARSFVFANNRLMLKHLMMQNYGDFDELAGQINKQAEDNTLARIGTVIYHSLKTAVLHNEVEPADRKQLLSFSEQLSAYNYDDVQIMLPVYFVALNCIGEWEITIDICNRAGLGYSGKLSDIPECYNYFCELFYADALLSAGKMAEARIILNRLSNPEFVLNRIFFEICFNIINARYYKLEGKTEAAGQELAKAESVAWKYGFDLMIEIIGKEKVRPPFSEIIAIT